MRGGKRIIYPLYIYTARICFIRAIHRLGVMVMACFAVNGIVNLYIAHIRREVYGPARSDIVLYLDNILYCISFVLPMR